MKSNFITKLFGLAVIFLATLMFSCSDDNHGKTVVMDVSPNLVWVGVRPPGRANDSVQVMKCLVEGTNQDLYIGRSKIEGFEYAEGFTYKLLVRIMPIENPPADGYTDRYELLKIISKQNN